MDPVKGIVWVAALNRVFYVPHEALLVRMMLSVSHLTLSSRISGDCWSLKTNSNLLSWAQKREDGTAHHWFNCTPYYSRAYLLNFYSWPVLMKEIQLRAFQTSLERSTKGNTGVVHHNKSGNYSHLFTQALISHLHYLFICSWERLLSCHSGMHGYQRPPPDRASLIK